MIILLAFVLPLMLFLVVWQTPSVTNAITSRVPPALRPWLPLVVMSLVAMVSTLAAVGWLRGAATWRDHTEIAWTSVRPAQADAPLVVGGPPELADIGWPTGAWWPQITVALQPDGRARLSVRGGGAVVRHDGQALHGAMLAPGGGTAVDGVFVSWTCWWPGTPLPCWGHLTLEAGGQRVDAEDAVDVRARTFSGRVQENVARLRATGVPANAEAALAVETWADTAILTRDAGAPAMRLIGTSDRDAEASGTTTDLALPAHLEISWPGRTLHAELRRDHDGAPRLVFRPPWKRVSPLPDMPGGRAEVLTVTGDPRPGDVAFVLPVGDRLSSARRDVRLVPHDGGVRFDGGHVPRDPGRERLLPGLVPRIREGETPRGVVSTLDVPFESVVTELMIVRDLLDPRATTVSVLLALLVFLGVGGWAARTIDTPDRWPVALVATVAWQIVLFRHLLAARYALDPEGLDAIAVRGLATATIALTILPALVWVAARLYLHAYRLHSLQRQDHLRASRAATWNMVVVAALLGLSVTQWFYTLALWPNLSARQIPSALPVAMAIGLALAPFLVHAIAVRLGLRRMDEVPRGTWLLLPQQFIVGGGQRIWSAVTARPFRVVAVMVAVTVTFLLAWVALAVAHYALRGVKLAQEVGVPLLLVGVPVLTWCALLAMTEWVERKDLRPTWLAVLLVSVPLAALPIVSPVALGDVGGLFATIAIMVPLGCLMMALTLPRIGTVIVGWAAAAIVFGTMTVSLGAPFLPDVVVHRLERGLSRYVVYRMGEDAQQLLPYTQRHPAVGNGVPVQGLQNSITHDWENQAMAHGGRLRGRGYGQAPTRQSFVPQDTLQFDSTFSFFVVSEHGFIGGMGLLLLYACPLAIVLLCARRGFGIGHAVAALIAAAFLNEALIHAGMNLGALPFTGRNLPLLSVNSLTDLLRWVVMFSVLAPALLWGATAGDGSLAPQVDASLLDSWQGRHARARALARVAVSIAAPSAIFFMVAVVWPSWKVWSNERLAEPFTWGDYLQAVQRLIDDGDLAWDAEHQRVLTEQLPIEREGDTVVEQEVSRFNALPLDEKFETPARFTGSLEKIASVAQYDAVLDALRTATSRRRTRRRPPLFRVLRDTVVDGGTGEEHVVERLVVNPAIDTSLQFSGDRGPDQVPTVRFRPRGPGAAGTMLVGPAWVNGRWRAVRNTQADVPWLQRLGDVIASRWSDDHVRAAREFGILTLDESLQGAAMRFVAEKGRLRHAQLLAANTRAVDRTAAKLPPRLALSIVELPTGKVAALGGWPRTSTTRQWTLRGSELLPPAGWLGYDAPGALDRRYKGDRNFDRIEMGSASKPLWALGALMVHPFLSASLATRGASGTDHSVFGIPLNGSPWHVTPSRWRKFPAYLSQSDNRYHVRLGFLALAGNDGASIRTDGPSDSADESMNGGRSTWGRVPSFPASIGFGSGRPAVLHNLEATSLAAHLREAFGVGVAGNDVRPYRVSFWTGDESDNLPNSGHWSATLASLSPEATQLRLDGIETPRQFVSALLGGDENRWSNVEFAAAFATAVTGHPVIPHISDGVAAKPLPTRATVPALAKLLRPGLSDTVINGTASTAMKRAGALAAFPRGVSLYAKTGTLALDGGLPQTSRLVLAAIRWENQERGFVKNGLVFSLVIERGRQGLAAEWLAEFLATHAADVRALLAR